MAAKKLFFLETRQPTRAWEVFAFFYNEEDARYHLRDLAADTWRISSQDVSRVACPWCERVDAAVGRPKGDPPQVLRGENLRYGQTECNDCLIYLQSNCACHCGCVLGQVLGHPSFAVPGDVDGDEDLLARFRASHGEPPKTLWRRHNASAP